MDFTEVTYEEDGMQGFMLLDDDVVVVNFFWWSGPLERQVPAPTEEDPDATMTIYEPRTSYEDVIEALPQRLESMGFGEHINEITQRVTEVYG
jgi:hypothetical protein